MVTDDEKALIRACGQVSHRFLTARSGRPTCTVLGVGEPTSSIDVESMLSRVPFLSEYPPASAAERARV